MYLRLPHYALNRSSALVIALIRQLAAVEFRIRGVVCGPLYVSYLLRLILTLKINGRPVRSLSSGIITRSLTLTMVVGYSGDHLS